MADAPCFHKGRGAGGNPPVRFHETHCVAVDDGWVSGDSRVPLRTRVHVERPRRVIQYNDSPDVPFDRSLNPYRGCEHGCIYCYARPSHAYLGLSPGLDFESRLSAKVGAAACLRRELAAPGYRCAPIALGVNTDAWQPVERRLGITRELLRVLVEARHPVTIVTKSALIERDLDLLQSLARDRLVHVALSITTLDAGLARRMEPRAAAPSRRLETLERLARAGVPAGVMLAPVIPFLNDAGMERLLARCREAGASFARYVFLRLPGEVAPLFEGWLGEHYPQRARRVLARIRDSRGGRLNQSTFGTRMRAEGVYAQLIGQRFRKAYRRLGFGAAPPLETGAFRRPLDEGGQLSLFNQPGH